MHLAQRHHPLAHTADIGHSRRSHTSILLAITVPDDGLREALEGACGIRGGRTVARGRERRRKKGVAYMLYTLPLRKKRDRSKYRALRGFTAGERAIERRRHSERDIAALALRFLYRPSRGIRVAHCYPSERFAHGSSNSSFLPGPAPRFFLRGLPHPTRTMWTAIVDAAPRRAGRRGKERCDPDGAGGQAQRRCSGQL